MARKKEIRKKQSREKELPPPMLPVRRWFPAQLVIIVAVVAVLLAVTWARPRACGDFFVALAAGRDIIQSRLGSMTEPDSWSFTTTDRVWFDQNWGTHVLFYLTWVAGGELGELILKGGVLAAMAFFITMRCRQRGVDWPMAVLVGGTAVAAQRAFIDMRPNLMTLTFAPLMAWLLLRTREKPHNAWVALGALILWSNVHGGFVFGLAMMGLWTLCMFGAHAVRGGIVPTLRRQWPIPLATLAAIILAGTLTPFGIQNLTHPLVVRESEEWRGISEWMPIHKGTFGSTWEFFTTMGMLVGLSVVSILIYLLFHKKGRLRLKVEHLVLLGYSLCLCVVLAVLGIDWRPEERFEAHHAAVLSISFGVIVVGGLVGAILCVGLLRRRASGRKYRLEGATGSDVATYIFELVLACVVITMAIKARRFIPLAVFLLVPLVAVQLEWLYRAIGRAWVLIPILLALIVPAFWTPSRKLYRPPGPALYKGYRHDNPFLPPLTIFQRMVICKNYPFGGTQFISENNVTSRVFHDWRWEGFLRWRTPQLKLFIGGRAQQVYSEETFFLFRRIFQKTEHETLNRLGMHMMVIPEDNKHRKLIVEMVWGRQARWAYVYWNDGKVIIVDVRSPQMKELIKRVASGQAKYPSEDIAAISRAMCLASNVVRTTNPQIVQAFKDAIALRPHVMAYRKLAKMNSNGHMPTTDLIAYFERESERLEAMSVDCADGIRILNCRGFVANTLFKLNKRIANAREVRRWQEAMLRVRSKVEQLKKKWQ